MSDPHVPDSEIQVIKNAILGFVDTMNSEKRMVEQQIREKTENIRSNALGSGASQFSYQDVDELTRQYKDEFLNYYRNTIHLKIIANASSHMKQAIQEGLINADVVQQEWLDGFEELQSQINQYQQVADRADALESELEGSIAVQGDISELQQKLREKDQIIAEKDQEIMNLNEGLTRMENQMNSLGQNMLENSMTIEELQEAINDRDIKISNLKSQLSETQGSDAEIEALQQQLQESKERERELQQVASNASSDLVTQLQSNLEETREQVLELRRDLVKKNDELHNLRLEQDEQDVKTKQLDERIKELRREKLEAVQENEKLSETLTQTQEEKSKFKSDLEAKETQLESVTSRLNQTETQLSDLKEKLEGYEGKVAMSTEEQEKINSELTTLKEQLKTYQETIDYLKQVLGKDIKFRIMTIMSGMSDLVRLDDLSEAVGVPETVVRRAVVELADQGVLEANKEGRFLFCSTTKELNPPILLHNE